MATLLHALLRSAPVARARMNPAWREQCWGIAALAVAAVGLNGLTTGDHLFKTMISEPYWAVAGVDLSLLVSAGIAIWAARALARRERAGARVEPGATFDDALDDTLDEGDAAPEPRSGSALPSTARVQHG
jgi:hypothetical protein